MNKPPSISMGDSESLDSPSLVSDGISILDGTDSLFPLPPTSLNLQVFIPQEQIQKCLTVQLDDIIWDIKQKLFTSLQRPLPQSFNFGLFLPPCEGRAGKFLLEDRPICDYPFHDCVPYVELKYKKRVYKMLKIDESALKTLHSKSTVKKFLDYVKNRNAEKVERLCAQGFDPNFHDGQGETPLTIAAGVQNNRDVLIQLVGGGAHLDFRNAEGQTAMHKAAFLSIAENVRTLLELGASPNYRDPIGLTPLYYTMLTTDSPPEIAEMLLAEAADLSILDMHKNTPLHQACKNGLVKHVEQLLYYGADINAYNINGNTPLHVCAVNGRPDCALVLLFRGAKANLVNKQGQTAATIAQVVGNLVVADVIRNHNPQNVVPFRDNPKFNARRRQQTPTNSTTLTRHRSLSHVSISSLGSNQNFLQQSSQHIPILANGQNPSISESNSFNEISSGSNYGPSTSKRQPVAESAMSDYGTFRKINPDAIQSTPGFQPNIPRILVIPRGPKGFGFILRGAKQTNNVELDQNVPAMQFFEGVDMSGMAMKAGLRPGDYLLEINGIDVRMASHEQVVHLIHQAGDIVTLTVITVDQSQSMMRPTGSHSHSGTLKRNHSLPRNSIVRNAPLPPQRHPSTCLGTGSLSFQPCSYPSGGSTADYAPVTAAQENNYRTSVPNDNNYSNTIAQASNSYHSDHPSLSQTENGLLSIDIAQHVVIPKQLNNSNLNNEPIRCASVKSRSSVSRRISAAELEHLMLRQSSSTSVPLPSEPYLPPSLYNESGPNPGNGPKKYTSVAEMKRRTQQRNSAQSPIIDQQEPTCSANLNDLTNNNNELQSARSRSVLRPKTPPPPPPPVNIKNCLNSEPLIKTNGGPPPPPPPPPPDFLKAKKSQTSLPATNSRSTNSLSTHAKSRGITSEALQNVTLKSVSQQQQQKEAPKTVPESDSKQRAKEHFDSDLRNALAKRRTKVMEEDVKQEKTVQPKEKISDKGKNPPPLGQYNGLSLRESVRENVYAPTKTHSIKQPNHSPPGGFFGAKKDSGYTSSRTSITSDADNADNIMRDFSKTSLEPSECGDDSPHHNLTSVPSSSLPSSTTVDESVHPEDSSPSILIHDSKYRVNRVTLLSQQLEDASIEPVSIACAVDQTPPRPLIFENPLRTPNPDYDAEFDLPDGSGDLRPSNSLKPNEIQISNDFQQKKLVEWSNADVLSWLHHIDLTEYMDSFSNVTGAQLVDFTRVKFTSLGVTRIAHRQVMEQSLKTAINPVQT